MSDVKRIPSAEWRQTEVVDWHKTALLLLLLLPLAFNMVVAKSLSTGDTEPPANIPDREAYQADSKQHTLDSTWTASKLPSNHTTTATTTTATATATTAAGAAGTTTTGTTQQPKNKIKQNNARIRSSSHSEMNHATSDGSR